MENSRLCAVLALLGCSCDGVSARRFCAEEDGTPYNVWRIDTPQGAYVLKKTSPEERRVYEAFFTKEDTFVPAVYGYAEYEGELYMLMEYIDGQSMCNCTRKQLTLTLDSLIAMQERFWNDTAHADIGYGFSASWPNRKKRLQYMGDLARAYSAYLEEFRTIPRTLCNDDMLPINVLVTKERSVIIDWEFGGILPYPCALARLIAFGEETPGELFYMSREDRDFALDYYYRRIISKKGIGREEYDRTMKLFFFKEYSEWVYCAGMSGDYDSPYYARYAPMAQQLAQELGLN